MRAEISLLCAILFSIALAASTAPRKWQDATIAAISSQASEVGIFAPPLAIGRRAIYYRVESEDKIYILALVIPPRLLSEARKPLNVTLHGKTKIAIDGANAHILDDAGKDVKLPIVEKIAK